MTRRPTPPLHVVPQLYEPGDPGPFAEFGLEPEPVPEPVSEPEPAKQSVRSGPRLQSSADQDVAEEVIRVLSAKYGAPLVFDEEQLWRYDGKGVWEPQPEEETRNLICSWNGTQLVDADGNGKTKKDGSPVLFAGNHRTAVSATLRINDMCSRKGFFGAPTSGVMFSDMFVRVTDDGDIVAIPPSPDCRARFRIDEPYPSDPLAVPEDYKDAMFRALDGENDKDALAKIAITQEWFGLALIGRSPNARALMLLGPERSGKSVTAKIGLGVFPPSVRSAMSIKSLDPSGMSSTQSSYFLAQLSMSRINADLDLPGGQFVGGENFKKIVTGEVMQGRHPMGRPFQFTPRVAMLFAGESLPNPEDKNRGFFRRWIVIHYRNQVAEADVVQNYEEKVLKNERAKIASWFIQGAAAAIKRGRFDIPASVESEIGSWIMNVDSVTQFCKRYCEPAPNMPHDKWLTAEDLCEKYNTWATRFGYKARSPIGFGRDLKRNFAPEYGYVDSTKTLRWGYRYVEGGVRSVKVEEEWP